MSDVSKTGHLPKEEKQSPVAQSATINCWGMQSENVPTAVPDARSVASSMRMVVPSNMSKAGCLSAHF